jgi:hypothetical protein
MFLIAHKKLTPVFVLEFIRNSFQHFSSCLFATHNYTVSSGVCFVLVTVCDLCICVDFRTGTALLHWLLTL